MSDGFIYTEYEQYFEEEEKKQKAADKKFRILKILVLALSAFLIVNIVLYAVVFPCFSPPRIVFSGLKNLSEDKILRESGMDFSSSWISFDKNEFEARLASNPALDADNLKVEKKFPDQVLVHVSERVPVVTSMMNLNGKTRTVQIDKNGVVFTSADMGILRQIPLVTGLELEKISEGFHIATKYRSLLEQISSIAAAYPVYLSALSEIHVRTLATGSYELVIYPIHSRVRVVTDHSLSEEALRYMLLVLDFIDSVDSDVTEIDMRYGSVSYRNAEKIASLEGIRE